MTATLPRSHLDVSQEPQPARVAVTARWHRLRCLTGLITAALAIVSGLILAWPAMAVVALFGLGIAADATLALRSGRRAVGPTLVADISFTGVALILVDVPSAAIGVVVAYFVLVVAVLGRSQRAWVVGLYAIVVGVIASFTPPIPGLPDVQFERSLVAGIIVVAVFGIFTIAMVEEFAIVRKRGYESIGHKIEMAAAISHASRALVVDDDASALSKALDSICKALGASVVFVERNVEEPDLGLCAVVVARSAASEHAHPSIDRTAKAPWSVMPRARSHLEGGAPFFYRVEEARGTVADRGGQAGLHVEVDVPIVMHDRWVGVIGAGDHDTDRVWCTDDLVLLRTLADLTAAFWQRADDAKVRESLIGSLDGRLRFEEALARSSRTLLGESSADLSAALDAIGTAAKVDEVVVTKTVADDDGEPVAEVLAVWAPVSGVSRVGVGDRLTYVSLPQVRDDIQRGETSVSSEGGVSRIVAGIEVDGAWFGSVEFIANDDRHGWSQRTYVFLRTIADIFGAFYERAQIRTRLEASLSSKDQLIASVSHELRTPLTAVVGIAEELVSSDESFTAQDRVELLGVIAAESREMADLIEDLLVAARSKGGAIPVFPERVDLALIAQNIRSHLSAPEHVTLTIEDVPSVAYADPVRVRQIIRNLLTNAFRYGGPEVTVRFGTIGGSAFVDVHDNGSGIASEDQEVIFEAYGRAVGGKENTASVGLGLTLSKLLAELMGGTLEYVEGEGCTFRLLMPRPEPDDR